MVKGLMIESYLLTAIKNPRAGYTACPSPTPALDGKNGAAGAGAGRSAVIATSKALYENAGRGQVPRPFCFIRHWRRSIRSPYRWPTAPARQGCPLRLPCKRIIFPIIVL